MDTFMHPWILFCILMKVSIDTAKKKNESIDASIFFTKYPWILFLYPWIRRLIHKVSMDTIMYPWILMYVSMKNDNINYVLMDT